mmetsp:Transcript_65249/g.212497  ORF Transcript_65249/g.212497 Transcript_65249/m.212497 type:complete len:221 (+) Transcript_65249:257-919(+)
MVECLRVSVQKESDEWTARQLNKVASRKGTPQGWKVRLALQRIPERSATTRMKWTSLRGGALRSPQGDLARGRSREARSRGVHARRTWMPTTSSGATRTVKEVGPLQWTKRCKRQPGMRDKTCKQVAVRKFPQASAKATNCGCAVRECPGGARRESRCHEGLKTLTSLHAASSTERRTCRLEATIGGGQGRAEGEVLHARDRVCEVEISPRASSASRRRR